MNYAKPELTLSGSTLDTIQQQVKSTPTYPDTVHPLQANTNGAYEADE
jgi:hypothetical protein